MRCVVSGHQHTFTAHFPFLSTCLNNLPWTLAGSVIHSFLVHKRFLSERSDSNNSRFNTNEQLTSLLPNCSVICIHYTFCLHFQSKHVTTNASGLWLVEGHSTFIHLTTFCQSLEVATVSKLLQMAMLWPHLGLKKPQETHHFQRVPGFDKLCASAAMHHPAWTLHLRYRFEIRPRHRFLAPYIAGYEKKWSWTGECIFGGA